jgi:hypothetical protein
MAISHVFTSPIAEATGTNTIWWGTTTSTVAATQMVGPNEWNSAHNMYYTLAGNTFNSSTISGTDVQWAASGPSISIGASGSSIIISSPPFISSYQNIPVPGHNATTASFNGASQSYAAAFILPEPGSFSFLRILVSMTTGSTTLATTAATLSASINITSTWNAVVYSLGTGANSRSLQSVASGSNSWVGQQSISVAANGTQYSITQNQTYYVEGGSTTTSSTSAFSTSNYSFASSLQSNLSGGRFLDINFANSLSAGPYWLVIGYSSSSATNSTGISNASANIIKYSNHYIVSQVNSAFGIMNSTNLTSGAMLGAGVFSTAGGGTTNSIPISAISSTASHPYIGFQMLRSA